MRVLYFHSLRQIVGHDAEDMDEAPADVGSLLDLLTERHPALRAHLPTLVVARNHEWVDRDEPLAADDEVALMPPVSGG